MRSSFRDTDADGRISFYDLNNSANRDGYIDAGDLLNPTSAGGWEDAVNGRGNANDRYVDDIIGWDFAEGDNGLPRISQSETRRHAPHCSRKIASPREISAPADDPLP